MYLGPQARVIELAHFTHNLVAEGRQVYGVRVLSSTLEDVYLEAVHGTTS